jgi:hypothetical protein
VRWIRDRALTLVLMAMFLVCLVGQLMTGLYEYNETQVEHGQSAVAVGAYLMTGHPWEALFENWESEFLQMGLYVILTVFLIQRGSAESRDPDEPEKEDLPSNLANAPSPVRKGGWTLKLYSHSLSLAFALLFIASFIGHAVCGTRAYNEEAVEHGKEALSLWQYCGTSQFWFESFQNWQSEFLAIFAIVILSIWLREKGSPESKSVAAPHAKTAG